MAKYELEFYKTKKNEYLSLKAQKDSLLADLDSAIEIKDWVATGNLLPQIQQLEIDIAEVEERLELYLIKDIMYYIAQDSGTTFTLDGVDVTDYQTIKGKLKYDK